MQGSLEHAHDVGLCDDACWAGEDVTRPGVYESGAPTWRAGGNNAEGGLVYRW